MGSFEIKPGNPIGEIIAAMFGHKKTPSTGKITTPICLTFALVADANVHSWENPYDTDFLVHVQLNVVTVDATETMDVGVAASAVTNDTLLDGAAISAAILYDSRDDGHSGSNGLASKLLNKNGGTNDFLVWTASAGTDTLAGTITFTLTPIDA